jgi:hypothetical protein
VFPAPSVAITVSAVGPTGRLTVALNAPPAPRVRGAPFSVAATIPEGSGPTAPDTAICCSGPAAPSAGALMAIGGGDASVGTSSRAKTSSLRFVSPGTRSRPALSV